MKAPFFTAWLDRLSLSRKLALLTFPFAVAVAGLLAASWFSMEILSGARAYVGGEGLWSKAQKGAMYRLARYAMFQDPTDFKHYQELIAVPLGDRQARLEMSKTTPDHNRIHEGFVRGRNHPSDVNTMTLMARRFHRVEVMNKAIQIWTDADAKIEELEALAERLHAEVIAGRMTVARTRFYLNELETLDDRITPLEDDFSYVLGDGARRLTRLAVILMAVATFLLLGTALCLAYLISRRVCGQIDYLRQGAQRLSRGEFGFPLETSGQDEISELSRSFAVMAEQRRQAEDALARKNEELHATNEKLITSERLKDEFFANASHELRTPLTLILSPLESLLTESGSLSPTMHSSLVLMHNNAMRLLQLVNGLLDFSKLEAGQLEVKREPVDLASVTQALVQDFNPWIERSHLKSSLEIRNVDGFFLMDRYLYERILFNLLSNAAKFTPAKGSIDVVLAWEDGQLKLTVTDTGIGIAADEQTTIFKRFRQVEGSATRRFEGAGLGLALVKEFAGLLEGEVTVESHLGKGSRFVLSCSAPRAQPAAATAQLEAHAPVPRYTEALLAEVSNGKEPRTGLSILVAEDNRELSSYIRSLLAPMARVSVVGDGDAALSAIEQDPPDLVLTDVMMPKRDGLSLCRELKARAETQHIPVILLTALTYRSALLEGWRAGANEYLFKPFHPKELVTRVQAMLQAIEQRNKDDVRIQTLMREVEQRAADLQVANKDLESFNYSVSHDLRAPLRAIDGFASALAEDWGERLDENGKRSLSRIRAGAQRMGRLIDDLLSFSRLGRLSLSMSQVDVQSLVQGVIDELSAQYAERKIQWKLGTLPATHADPVLLRQVFINLLSNAIKFTRQRAEPVIEVCGRADVSGTHYDVRDNGIGFDMRYASRLFGVFQRLYNSQNYEGTGVGLSIVARLVERHNGRITAEAHPDEGATFSFFIPRAADQSPTEIAA